LSFAGLPMLLGGAMLGFIAADLVLLLLVGAPMVRRFYRRHEIWIVRASGVMFMGFALNAILHALPGLIGKASLARS
jgi:threonine/homoserine/homoserine lactone efflux protein